MVFIVVAVMVTIVVGPMALFARLVQLAAALLRLPAVLTVFANGIVQGVLRFADTLLALSVIVMVAIQRPHGNGPGKEQCDHRRRHKRFTFLKHACLLEKPSGNILSQPGVAGRSRRKRKRK
jgi:hypothetical protein